MIVCVCNKLNCEQIKQAIQLGIIDSVKVHEYFNKYPKCGKCLIEIDKLIENKMRSVNEKKS